MIINEPERRYANWLLKQAIKSDDCLLCHFVPITAGYSYIRLDGKRVRAHRFIWTVFKGDIPDDFSVLHECDVRRCINLEHLFLGTSADNTKDMLDKGRHTYKHFDTTKVTPEILQEMLKLRNEGFSAPFIASRFNIAPSTVYEYTSPGGRRYAAD